MKISNSQEQTIYRKLIEQMQLGFYSDGERFPTVQEIARRFGVSYCPAQRALKALERDGLIAIGRGRETVVIKRPYENYLESGVFQGRADALMDLCQTLELITPAIGFQGIRQGGPYRFATPEKPGGGPESQWKALYRAFGQLLLTLGSQMARSLFYDIGAFIGSAFPDLVRTDCGQEEEARFLRRVAQACEQSLIFCQNDKTAAAKRLLECTGKEFFEQLRRLLAPHIGQIGRGERQQFLWTPYKGRAQYRDLIAVDMVRKIRQGIFPVGSLLPSHTQLADIYHVSVITIRRTIGLINQTGLTRTANGVGTYVVSAGEGSLARQIKTLAPDESLRTFLEAAQLLTITCEPVVNASFAHFSQQARQEILDALAIAKPGPSITATVAACLQALVHDSPLFAVREIYRNLTILLLNGNILEFQDFEGLTAGWPARAQRMREAVQSGDSSGFARLFRQFSAENFAIVKGMLCQGENAWAEHAATPVFCD